MAKIAKIEELAKEPEIDISEYGLKAEGLAILSQVRDEIRNDPENRDSRRKWDLRDAERDLENADRLELSKGKRKELEDKIAHLKECLFGPNPMYELNFEVDPAFAVPRSFEISDSSQLREMYSWLVSQPLRFMHLGRCETVDTPLRIMMARSSDEHEMPGKFETHFSLYDPAHQEESFREWLKVAQRVRESGAGGVIGQGLVAQGTIPSSLINFHSWSPIKYELEEGTITDTPKFGLANFGFVANTGSFFGANSPAIYSVLGLASKIVRGDTDFSLIKRTPYGGTSVTHSKHNYQGDLHVVKRDYFPQKTMDIIDVSNPNAIKTISFIQELMLMACDRDWGSYAMPYESMHAGAHFALLEILREKAGKHVEIEGAFMEDEHFPHIFQLRKYELPESRLERLAEVSQERIIDGGIVSYVAERLKGDLVIIEKQDGIDESMLRQKLKGSYIIMGPDGFVRDMSYTNMWGLNLEKFEDRIGCPNG